MSNGKKVRISRYICKISLKVPSGGITSDKAFWRGWIYVSKFKGNQFINLHIFQDHGSNGTCSGISYMIRSQLLKDLESVLEVNLPTRNEASFSFILSPSASFSGDFLPRSLKQ